MPNAGDGFTVVSAMRHSQPNALIVLISGYPDVSRAMATIAMEADQIVTKPFDLETLPELIKDKMAGRKTVRHVDKERVGEILNRCLGSILIDWLALAKQSAALNYLNLSDDERTGYLPKLVADLVARLDQPHGEVLNSGDVRSESAVEHGELRYLQGYTVPMLVQESRILQVTLFGTLQSNLSCLNFSLLLPDVMRIADEVDGQLTQTMESFVAAGHNAAAA